MNLDGTLYETVIPCLEFSIEFQSNKLIYHKEYTKRQQIIYVLIQHLHDREGWGYRKNKIIQAGYKIVKISYFNIFLFIPLVCVLLFKRIFYPKTMYESDLQDINKLTNQILTYIFSSERWLLKLISFPFGASIIAIVKKEK